MRFLSGAFIYGYRSFLGLSKRMKIDFRGLPVFMPQDFLDRSEWNSAVVHNGSSRMPHRMEPKIGDTGLFAKGLHYFGPLLEWPNDFFTGFGAPVSVPKNPRLGLVSLSKPL